MTPLLAARRAGRSFGGRLALRPTDLELNERDVVAVIGPNGAGKSTLLALLAGALAPLGVCSRSSRFRTTGRGRSGSRSATGSG